MPENGRVYVVDTNVPMTSSGCFEQLAIGGNEVVFPGPALQELANHMHSGDGQKRYLARIAMRAINTFCDYGSPASEKGVPTKSGGIFREEFRSENPKKLPRGFKVDDPDNQILLVCMLVARMEDKKPEKDRRPVILISKDVNMRHRAAGCNIQAQDYLSGRVDDVNATIYGSSIELTLEADDGTLDSIYRGQRQLSAADLNGAVSTATIESLFANQCVFLQAPGRKPVQTIFKKGHSLFRLVNPIKEYRHNVDGFIPRNEMQAFAMALLDDPAIEILTLIGIAGAGKTLLAMWWALENLQKKNGNGRYERIIVFRSNMEAGKDIGFLPGDVADKFGPFRSAIYGAIDYLTRHRVKGKFGRDEDTENGHGNSIVRELEDRGQLSIIPPNFSRGETFHNTIIIIDDAQNFEEATLQLVMTRAGEGSRVIITGDPTQIDNPRLDAADCGLVKAARNFRGLENCASIFLPDSERSGIAELAAKRLGSGSRTDHWK